MNTHPPASSPALAGVLAGHRVWGQLDEASRTAVLARFECTPVRLGDVLLPPGHLNRRLGLILTGVVRLQDPDLGLAVSLQAPDMFGLGATPAQPLAAWYPPYAPLPS